MGRTLTDAETLRDGGLEARHVGGDLRHLERLRQHHTEREAVVVRGAEGVQCRDALRSEPEADTAGDRKRPREETERILELTPALGRAEIGRRGGVCAL